MSYPVFAAEGLLGGGETGLQGVPPLRFHLVLIYGFGVPVEMAHGAGEDFGYVRGFDRGFDELAVESELDGFELVAEAMEEDLVEGVGDSELPDGDCGSRGQR